MGFCNPLTPDAYKYISRIPLASPLAFQWVLANTRQGQGQYRGDTLDFVDAPRTGSQNLTGAVIHDGLDRIPRDLPYGKWNHISIEVDGEVMYDATAALVEAPRVESYGNRSSILKARATLAMGTARQRVFDFDIGAGVEFDVAAYYLQKIELLIPDPLVVIPGDLSPPDPVAPQQMATVLTTAAYFTHQRPQGYPQPLTYTVPLTLEAGDTNDFAFVPRQADAIAIEVHTDELDAAGGGVTVDFIYIPSLAAPDGGPVGFRQAAYNGTPAGEAPTVFYVLDQVTLPPASTQIPRTLIPGNCNAFRVTRTFGTADTYVSLIQVLNV